MSIAFVTRIDLARLGVAERLDDLLRPAATTEPIAIVTAPGQR